MLENPLLQVYEEERMMASRTDKYGHRVENKPRTKRPYQKVRVQDKRGKTAKENALLQSFWKFHSMDDMMILDGKEQDKTLDLFLEVYIARQIKVKKVWNFPTYA